MKKIFFLIVVGCLSYLFYVLFFASNSVLNYYRKQQNLIDLQKKIEIIEKKNQDLEQSNSLARNKHQIEDILLDLGYTQKDEIIIDIKPPELETSSLPFLREKYLIPFSTIIFLSFLSLLIIIGLIFKYQSKMVLNGHSSEEFDSKI